jgi:hypothetical protein
MTRHQFLLDLVCPCCGRAGQGLASDEDGPGLGGPGFRVDEYPEGFSGAGRSACPTEILVRCDCGQEFYLL